LPRGIDWSETILSLGKSRMPHLLDGAGSHNGVLFNDCF